MVGSAEDAVRFVRDQLFPLPGVPEHDIDKKTKWSLRLSLSGRGAEHIQQEPAHAQVSAEW